MKSKFSIIGTSVHRFDAIDKVTGRAKYAADIQMAGMLQAKLLRSPYPHARVTHIDTRKARKLPGIRAIVSIKDVPKVVQYWFFLRTERKKKQMFIRDSVVRFIGDPVLAVAAEDEKMAEEALSLIHVKYNQLPAVFDPFEALKENGVKIHEGGNIAFHMSREFGDTNQGLKMADFIVENQYITSKQKHASIEPIGTCIADFSPDGRYTVYSSTQLPHWSQMYLAGALGVENNKIRIIKPYTGGAFGGRCGLIHGLEVMCCMLSRKAGKPVMMSFTREEDFTATETRHPMVITMKTGVSRDGILTANSIKLVSDVGGYGTHYIGVIANCLSTAVGLYRCPNICFEATAVYTNKSPAGAMRGYGNPQMNFAQESQMDMLAKAASMDPVEFRIRNYRGLGEIDPVFTHQIRSDGLKECLQKGAKSFGWNKKKANLHAKGTTKRGVGMSIMLHGTGAAKALPDPASAIIMMNADGSVNLVTAAADDGQGNRTVLAQIASEELGISLKKISISNTDTAVTPLDAGTHGSRQTYSGGLAVKKAAAEAKKKIFIAAEKELNVEKKQLAIKDGLVYDTKNSATSIHLSDLMRKLQIEDMSGCNQIIGISSGVAPAMPGYYGANFADVEVDTETGQVRVIKFVAAFDVGKAINPRFVEGQIIGGSIMGIGWALTEELLIKDGRILNGSFSDYRILRTTDIPELESIVVESYEPTGPFGAKGVGEGGSVCAASAIANAIYDATGIRLKKLCLTQEKILEALLQR